MHSTHETEPRPFPAALDATLRSILGGRGYLTDPADCAAYCQDWRGLYRGRSPAILRPSSTAEVSASVGACHEYGVAIVPQGGNTGMVGGATPSEDGGQLVLSLARLNKVREVDPLDMVMEVEAGVPLASAQQAAQAVGCLLPLSIASEGTAQIGGVLATNAGGNNTLRYGNARDLLLGLEVVLPDGSVWNGLRRLRKDNTGYRLSQLFAGSEGTLGIITAATLKLEPYPTLREVAICAVPSPDAALHLCQLIRRHDAPSLQAFEYMSALGLALVLEHIPGTSQPLDVISEHYVLLEFATCRANADLRAEMEHLLGSAMEDGWVDDVVIAQSEAQRAALWKLREEHSEAQRRAGASIKNDVSVPISRIPAFLQQAADACLRIAPDSRIAPFGHFGDGNIHFNLVQGRGASPEPFLAKSEALMNVVNEIAIELGGSFSAEHGIGRLKAHMLPHWRGGAELMTMQAIKRAIDPQGLLNPGKVFPSIW